MKIPEAKIEEIKNTVSIVDLISGYVQLRKRGKNFIGLCPFHQEKTPSFTVSDDKQIYHCFGCHVGGNIYSFLMDYKKISFVESVQEVAEYAGISLEYEQGYDSSVKDELEVLYEINVIAAKFFADKLYKSIEGQLARDYLESRNIKLTTQRLFGMGFAPDSWSALKNTLEENKVDLFKAQDLGLIDKKATGNFYDKFRDRVVFPIFSPNGRVVGFGGRVMTKTDKAAKYLNSSESKIYSKRKSLYGLYQSKEEISKLDKAILVEGYMDLISLFQGGIKNVVASSGTSLTEEQIQLLSRFSKKIIIMFDADFAGQKAAMRSIELLLKQDFEIQALMLPEGEDPDSYINKFGKEDFEEKLSRAPNFLEFQFQQFSSKENFKDPDKQAEAVREIVRSLSYLNDDLKRNLHLKNLARKFNLRENMLENELDKFIKSNEKQKFSEERRSEYAEIRNEKAAAIKSKPQINGLGTGFEKEVIELLFDGSDSIIGYIFDHIQPDEFENEDFRIVAQTVYDAYKEDIIKPDILIERIEDEQIRNLMREMVLSERVISKKWQDIHYSGKLDKDIMKYTADLVRRYMLSKIDQQIKAMNSEFSTADSERAVELFEEIKLLQEEKKNIQSETHTELN